MRQQAGQYMSVGASAVSHQLLFFHACCGYMHCLSLHRQLFITNFNYFLKIYEKSMRGLGFSLDFLDPNHHDQKGMTVYCRRLNERMNLYCYCYFIVGVDSLGALYSKADRPVCYGGAFKLRKSCL